MTPAASRARATLLGFGAILLWAVLAALTASVGPVPPFQLSALTFAIGTGVGMIWTLATEGSIKPAFAIRLPSLLLGVYGLLLFHACYFFALQRAPAVEASLIIYLWPLLIVLFSGVLPANTGGAPLTFRHIAGALLGLAGTALIIRGADTSGSIQGNIDGYLMAALAAFIWASYSVASRMLAAVSTATVTISCAATAIGAAVLHILLETTVWPQNPGAWASVLALGVGPVGLAFFLWDEGMKRGDIRLLGVGSYATPLLSTFILAIMGVSKITMATWIATALISAGAMIAGVKTKR